MELDALPAAPWQIAPFCSPAYGRPDGAHWIDRNPMAWRVTVSLVQPYRHRAFALRVAPAAIYERDPTAPAPNYLRPDYFVFTERAGVVIAAFPHKDIAKTRATIEALALPHMESVEYWELTPELTQCRIHVGTVTFPDGEVRLTETMAACMDVGALCRWSELAPYNEVW